MQNVEVIQSTLRSETDRSETETDHSMNVEDIEMTESVRRRRGRGSDTGRDHSVEDRRVRRRTDITCEASLLGL